MKKNKILRLVVLLAVLLVIYGTTEFFSATGRSKSLRKELVFIHTESVTKIIISKEGNSTQLTKSEDQWTVADGTYLHLAVQSKVENALTTLKTIIPARIASRNPEKWKEFQVDSTGTRVQVFEGNGKVLDIVLGRFGMQGQQQFHTYVRLFEENDVYVAPNFMSFSFPSNANGYRNGQVVSIQPDSIISISFDYVDSSFTLLKNPNGVWLVDHAQADSAKVVAYLNVLRSKTSGNFYDGNPETILDSQYRIEILRTNSETITIMAQIQDDLVQSSENPESIFSDSILIDALFIGKNNLATETKYNK